MTVSPVAIIRLFKEQPENETKRIADDHSLLKRGDHLIWWYFLRLRNMPAVDIAEVNVDGGGELGLDVVHIDDNEIVHFYQFSNPENLEKGFPTGDVDKVISGLQLIFDRKHHDVADNRLRVRTEDN